LRLFENILVPKFGAKIRRRDLKTENDRKKRKRGFFQGLRFGFFNRIERKELPKK